MLGWTLPAKGRFSAELKLGETALTVAVVGFNVEEAFLLPFSFRSLRQSCDASVGCWWPGPHSQAVALLFHVLIWVVDSNDD